MRGEPNLIRTSPDAGGGRQKVRLRGFWCAKSDIVLYECMYACVHIYIYIYIYIHNIHTHTPIYTCSIYLGYVITVSIIF